MFPFSPRKIAPRSSIVCRSPTSFSSVPLAYRIMTRGQPLASFLFQPDFDRPGVVRAQRTLDLVQRMGAPAGHAPRLPAAVVILPECPAVMELRMIRPQFHLVGPQIPVQSLGNRLLGLRLPHGRSFKVVDDHFGHLADRPVANKFAAVGVDRHGTLLSPGLQDPAKLARGVGQDPALRRWLASAVSRRTRRSRRPERAACTRRGRGPWSPRRRRPTSPDPASAGYLRTSSTTRACRSGTLFLHRFHHPVATREVRIGHRDDGCARQVFVKRDRHLMLLVPRPRSLEVRGTRPPGRPGRPAATTCTPAASANVRRSSTTRRPAIS